MKFVKIFGAFVIIIALAGISYADNFKKFSTSYQTNHGKKWKIGYFQGGDYVNYQSYLSSTIRGLMDLGWIKETKIPEIKGNTRLFWEWLSTKAQSDYIEFLSDAYYTCDWDKSTRKKVANRLISRLADDDNNIDLMIAMGTWAGKDLSNNLHHVNTIIMSTSDPVESGIIKSIQDSGFDHIHARIDPLRYERQIMIFNDMVKFKTLGVAYEDSIAGRSYAAVDAIETVAAQKGFKIARCFTQSDISDQELMNRSVIKCFSELIPKVDAIYVTVQGGVNSTTIPTLVKMTQENRIPTFSQFGSTEVQQGFLMSMSRKNGFKSAGRYFAALVAQIFNGAKPRELNQVFEEEQNLALNLKTAELIGFYLYADIIAAADEIYRDIKEPE
nr:ABC transporter substrate binding protein [uncultured Desulfobacter sp.]